MTPLAHIFSRLRRPRTPAPDWWGPACTCTICVPRDARADLHATLRAETRYDAELPDVIAAEAPPKWADLYGIDPDFLGGDLAAMAAPADWPEFSGWGEGYEIEPETRIGRHGWTPAEMRAMGDAIHDVVQAAHPPTPPVDEADVEALAEALESADLNNHAEGTYKPAARRLLSTGRVSVTR